MAEEAEEAAAGAVEGATGADGILIATLCVGVCCCTNRDCTLNIRFMLGRLACRMVDFRGGCDTQRKGDQRRKLVF